MTLDTTAGAARCARGDARETFVHVGMHKCASTFLQSRFFPALAGARYLEPGFLGGLLREYRAQPEAALARLASTLAELPDRRLLLSNESVASRPDRDYEMLEANARALHAMFPRARILLIVRRQDDYLESLYKQVVEGNTAYPYSIRSFLNLRGDGFGAFHREFPNVDVRRVDLFGMYRTYRDRFGAGNVLVVPFEELRRDQRGFLERIVRFMGLDDAHVPERLCAANVSRGAGGLQAVLLRNRVRHLARQALPCAVAALRGDPASSWRHARAALRPFADFLRVAELRQAASTGRLLREPVRRRILDLHRHSNRMLGEASGVDLERYGYY